MEKIQNPQLIDYYYKKYNFDEIFSNDIKKHLELFSYNRYEHICTENTDINYILFFVKGKSKVYNTLSNGKSLMICFYSPLMILGDLELFDASDNPTNVQALELSYCIGIKMSYAKQFLINDIKFMKYISYALANKLGKSSINSAINLLHKLENRLASYILSMYVDVEIDGYSMCIFDENLSNTSELLGTSYRHLLRTLKGFCEQGILKKHDTFYEVVDLNLLESLAMDLYK